MADIPSDEENEELGSRPPLEEDLVLICRQLNEVGARYLVCGGFAIIQSGYPRFTGDIDLLVDTSLENEAKVFRALEVLPDQAVRDLDAGDIAKYVVCRVNDEVTVDLMGSASGIDFADASHHIVTRQVQDVLIPFASPQLLWRMKINTHREKDRPDLQFLRQLFEAEGIVPQD
jgi:hypothetical protein